MLNSFDYHPPVSLQGDKQQNNQYLEENNSKNERQRKAAE